MFPFAPSGPESVDSAAHLIQLALTPVFMLSGIGTLINIFNTRLARVSDHLEDVNKRLASPPDAANPELAAYYSHSRLEASQRRLRRRMFVLDIAIIFNGLGGAFTCGAALALFLGTLRPSTTSFWMLVLFGSALACTVLALLAFLADTILGWHGSGKDGKASLLISLKMHSPKAAKPAGAAGGATRPEGEAGDAPDRPEGSEPAASIPGQD
ncbi:DUF2721 domain-containing protein [Formicincola oecophyllae]|uniref:DUF2721 domain-containing protein n=2 Tax=Formicincola oecophyllae TaxID=2558361 RepID=A0A4Y6UAE7_9PROT|nr:DUF2721 domain-containing protein [Formicincola oecophyllae]